MQQAHGIAALGHVIFCELLKPRACERLEIDREPADEGFGLRQTQLVLGMESPEEQDAARSVGCWVDTQCMMHDAERERTYLTVRKTALNNPWSCTSAKGLSSPSTASAWSGDQPWV